MADQPKPNPIPIDDPIAAAEYQRVVGQMDVCVWDLLETFRAGGINDEWVAVAAITSVARFMAQSLRRQDRLPTPQDLLVAVMRVTRAAAPQLLYAGEEKPPTPPPPKEGGPNA